MGAAESHTPVPAVIASHVDIVYRVFGSRERTGSGLRDLVTRRDRAPRTVHAVKDVSFVAHHGEAIGIIGRNGSGKSTLLRSVAGLIPPTSGEVWAAGTPALLGVNAILVRSLSGARNVYIGAQALGLSKDEVDEVFDEIVEFSGIGDAIHLPMSTYSSGMAARLRFAISTAATPGVLVIDEALATGDAHFRARSVERITSLRQRASTVFIVSHSASTIRQMCERAIWLDAGCLVADGPVDDVLNAYGAAGRPAKPSAPVPERDVPGVARWSSSDRYGTSWALVARSLSSDADRVLLAPGLHLATAFATIPEATRSGAPVALCPDDSRPVELRRVLDRLKLPSATVVGDQAWVDVVEPVAAASAGGEVSTIAAAGWVEAVAALLAADSHPAPGRPLYVVVSDDEAAAAAAALAAVADDGRVALVAPSGLSEQVVEVIRGLAPGRIITLGYDSELPATVVSILADIAPVSPWLSGSLIDAAVEVSARSHNPGVDVVYIGSESTVANLVSAVSVGGLIGAPVLVIDGTSIHPAVDAELRRLTPGRIVVIGGQGTISPGVREELSRYVAGQGNGDRVSDGI